MNFFRKRDREKEPKMFRVEFKILKLRKLTEPKWLYSTSKIN